MEHAHRVATYEWDAETVWSRIRPAENAVLPADVRAFTAPGTPLGANATARTGLLFRGDPGTVALSGCIVPPSPGCVDGTSCRA